MKYIFALFENIFSERVDVKAAVQNNILIPGFVSPFVKDAGDRVKIEPKENETLRRGHVKTK